MWAIETKYLGPTNHRGSRVRARFGESGAGMSVTLSWDDALNLDNNCRKAAEELRRRMVAEGRWGGAHATCPLIMACVRDGYVFVFNPGGE